MGENIHTRWLNRWLPKPNPRSLSKPRDMLYAVDEAPPLGMTLALGLQHALLALMLSVYGVIAASELGLSGGAVQEFVSTCILVAAVGTLLQASATRFGAGHLVVHIPTPVTLGTFIAVAGTLGLEAAAGGLLIGGILVLLLSRGVSRLRSIFPPEVTGVVVTMLGLSLVQGGVERSLGLTAGAVVIDGSAALVAGLTLMIIIALSIWGGQRWRNYAVLIGVGGGYLVTVVFGLDLGQAEPSESAARLFDLPLFDLPLAELPTPVLVMAAALPMVMVEVVNAVDNFGNLLTLDKMNDADWRRADLPMVSRGIFAQGIATLLSGLTGTPSTGISSANIGLAFATGVAARRVGLIAGLFLLVFAFMPQVSALIANTPRAVVGAILIYTAGYLIVAGMELILSRLLNPRRVFVVGLAIVAGMAIVVLPELPATAPSWAEPLLASSLAVAAIVAVVLNAVFQIGVKQRANFPVPERTPVAAAQDFVDSQGTAWGARRIVIARAAQSLGEAIELIEPLRQPDSPPLLLEAAFDEFFLEFTLSYEGLALSMAPEVDQVDLASIMEDEDDERLERALDALPLIMLKRLADRIRVGKRGKLTYLQLRFEH
ncbi:MULTISPECIES: uracil-xanthine permease family protein [Thiorhodovibrio]|uniref:uracil-xanthine permease family protein n=1 Tax=Thiorhodovibrio TaxID=61593 RepID=UPI00191414C2|nr:MULTISPECIES: solute carrier family 23 protein [Thiorhodovibrio]WPL10676.1 Uric acid transporter UacT [Thiorhodovibrio litoralis]